MTPIAALTGAVAIAAATAVSAPPMRHAAENIAPAVVREVKSLPVDLAAVNFFAPYYAMPAGLGGTLITVPLYVVTLAADNVVKGTTQLLTNLKVDKRLAQQPVVLTHSLVFPIATGAQIALASGLDGTYVYGKFTPAQALNFFVNAVKAAIDGFVAAEKALFTQPSLTAKTASQDVASPAVADPGSTVTLSTASADVTPKASPKHSAAAAPKAAPEPSTESTEDSEKATGDTEKADPPASDAPVVKKPTWKPPTFKLPTLKLPTFKLPAPKKATRTADTDTTSSAPKADAGSKDAGSEGSSK
jgi:acyl dehydratase